MDFHTFRDAERLSPSGMVGRKERRQQVLQSKLIAEFGRAEIEPSAAAQLAFANAATEERA